MPLNANQPSVKAFHGFHDSIFCVCRETKAFSKSPDTLMVHAVGSNLPCFEDLEKTAVFVNLYLMNPISAPP